MEFLTISLLRQSSEFLLPGQIVQGCLHHQDGGLLDPGQKLLRDDGAERDAMGRPLVDEIDADPPVPHEPAAVGLILLAVEALGQDRLNRHVVLGQQLRRLVLAHVPQQLFDLAAQGCSQPQ